MADERDPKDSDVTNDLSSGGGSFAGIGVRGDWNGSGGSGAVTVGGYDVLRFDPTQDIPGLGGLTTAIQKSAHLASDDPDWRELADIGGGVADLGANIVAYAADPLNFLISSGLTFLVDVVQPLEDLLGLVTGNAERMDAEIARWGRVAAALTPLADEIKQAADQGLLGWQGRTADAAKQRLHEFAGGVTGLADEVQKLTVIMSIARTLMAIAQGLVIGVLSTLVEWLVFTWSAAMAVAIPTAGASTAAAGACLRAFVRPSCAIRYAAGAATTVEVAESTTRAVRFVDRVVTLLGRLRAMLTRIHLDRMTRAEESFRRLGTNGLAQRDWHGPGVPVRNLFTDWRTWLSPGVQVANNAVNDLSTYLGSRGHDRPSGEQIDRALDEDR